MVTSCQECGALIDSTRHTLQECAAWRPQSYALMTVIGGDLSLSSDIRGMLDGERSLWAAASFCEEVMAIILP
ncbi:unnamed protein product [Euphydryas editha]|uniref:Uncharacterized protein n=1 Tax=Euphydryas editha TaxID=104508 RepID=A0AAU9V9V0_EUPED|nr:unnamed protein product [Euphydryas editha]